MREDITTTCGDDTGTIDSLITFLQNAKEKGATHYSMRWSNDPMWAFKWFETYRIKSSEELKALKIKQLESELLKTRNQ